MKMYNLVVTLLCFYALSTNTLVKSQNWLINELLPPDYNQSETPIHNPNDYLPVRASIRLYQFDVPFEQNAIEANLLFCLEWQDYRIRSLSSVSGQENNITRQMNYLNVKFTQLSRFWQPKVDFRNAESANVVESIRQVRYLQVWPEQKLLKSCSRLSVTFTCYMNLSTLPFDQQYCFFEVQTVQNSIQHLQLEMQSMESIVRGQRMFRVIETYKGGCFPLSDGETVHESENQPCVFGAIRLVRRVSYFVVRYYAPTFLTVCMSTLEFFIPTNGWPARIILTATVLLGLIRISVNAYNTIPVRDVVSLIWWIWGLHLIIYCCLCEFPLALAWYEFILEKKKAKATNTQSPDGIYFGRKGWYKACGVRIEAFLKVIYGPTDHYRDPINRNKVDYVARLVGPSVIGIYTLTYIVTTIPAWAPRYRWGSSQPLD